MNDPATGLADALRQRTLAAPTVLVAPADLAALAPLGEAAGIAVLPAEARPGGALAIAGEAEGAAASLHPLRLLGLAALSARSERSLDAVRTALAARFGIEAEAPRRFDAPPDPAAFLAWAAARLGALHALAATRNAALARELAALREGHDDLQAAFRRLETHLAALPETGRSLALVLEPQGAVVELGAGGRDAVSQRLPVASPGICDVGFHVGEGLGHPDGVLRVSLTARESGETLGEWKVAGAALRPGWVRLALARALGPDRQSLILAARWSGNGTVPLGLSVPHPEPRWCAATLDGPEARVLAVRAWTALPGVRAPQDSLSLAADRSMAADWRIAGDALRAVEGQGQRPDGVRHDPAREGVLVHPVDHAPTMARVPLACPTGMRHVRARVLAAHPDGPPLEYALAVRPVRDGGGTADGALPKQGLSSAWTRVPPGTVSEVHLFLPAPLADRADLYLGARLPHGAGAAPGPALFWDIRASGEDRGATG